MHSKPFDVLRVNRRRGGVKILGFSLPSLTALKEAHKAEIEALKARYEQDYAAALAERFAALTGEGIAHVRPTDLADAGQIAAWVEAAAAALGGIDVLVNNASGFGAPDTEEAWKRGLKTTYYLHMKPRHQAEQSTTRVNKTEEITSKGPKKSGFGFAKKQAV